MRRWVLISRAPQVGGASVGSALAGVAAPGTEDCEADKPEGRVVVGQVQLVEVRLREGARGNEVATKKLVGHPGEPRQRAAAPPGQGHAVMSEVVETEPLDQGGQAAPEGGVKGPACLQGGGERPHPRVEFRRARV